MLSYELAVAHKDINESHRNAINLIHLENNELR